MFAAGVGFRRGQYDVGQALGLQAQHAQFDRVIDQAGDATAELVAVGDECGQHADGELAIQPQPRAQPQHAQPLRAGGQALQRGEQHVQALHRDRGVERVGRRIEVAPSLLGFLLCRRIVCTPRTASRKRLCCFAVTVIWLRLASR